MKKIITSTATFRKYSGTSVHIQGEFINICEHKHIFIDAIEMSDIFFVYCNQTLIRNMLI